MLYGNQDYRLYHKFLKNFQPSSFNGINYDDRRLLELNEYMEHNKQFFYIADLINMEILFTSDQSKKMLGLAPEDVNFSFFMNATHPDDLQRLNFGRSILLKMGQELFIKKKGATLLSTNFRIKNINGKYSNYLVQCYLYYATVPYKTVFFLKVHTNIDSFEKIKNGYHYYKGNDLLFFKYPDDELLKMGNVFTKREFEIIKFIAAGLSSEEIAKKLYLSLYTINTHRGNILKKTKKEHISDLIYDLMERGVL